MVFIVDDNFSAVICEGDFCKDHLDADYVQQQEELITRGWQRLCELENSEKALIEYPLPEVLARFRL